MIRRLREKIANSSQSSENAPPSDGGARRQVSSRRAFLKGFGTAALAGAVPLATGLVRVQVAGASSGSPSLNIDARPHEALRKRIDAAAMDNKVRVPPHHNNGDEARYEDGIANYTKGFPHNQFGEVDPGVYAAYQAAVESGKSADFDHLTMGGNVPLVDPQAGLCFDLETLDVSQHSIPPFDTLSSAGLAAQAVEVYWQALARDVLFSQYDSDSTTLDAAAELGSLPAFQGPREYRGKVTARTLFRGFTPADLIGPYVSQFFLQQFTIGAIPVSGYMITLSLGEGGSNYMTDTTSWLKVQNGQTPFASAHPDPQLRYPRSGRDLAEYVHNDVLYQEYLNAALMLAGMHAPLNAGNPYDSLKSETGFITFGFPMIQVLVAEVIARALKNAWFQKWFVHRALRPEEFGGLVHFTKTRARDYPLHPSVLLSIAVGATFDRTGYYLIPHSYPEGSPQHPSYPSGHATAAGAAVTILKWFFKETTRIVDIGTPLVATPDGIGVTPYTGPDAEQMTVGGELNKLASNVGFGRIFSGIHWRSDVAQGMLLGEAVAISLLRDQADLYNEDYHGFTFTKFNGEKITV
jgi:membrane-associated phospholipid phosphatase